MSPTPASPRRKQIIGADACASCGGRGVLDSLSCDCPNCLGSGRKQDRRQDAPTFQARKG